MASAPPAGLLYGPFTTCNGWLRLFKMIMIRSAVALLLLCVERTMASAVVPTITVCITPDDGFNMLDPDADAGAITSDADVQGFDADLRRHVITRRLGQPYTIRVLGSYGELQVRTRLGECDVGWAPFYQTADRERCSPDPQRCVDAASADGIINWEPYRCCTDFSAPYMPWSVAVFYRHSTTSGGFSSLLSVFILFSEPFFVNFFSSMVCQMHAKKKNKQTGNWQKDIFY